MPSGVLPPLSPVCGRKDWGKWHANLVLQRWCWSCTLWLFNNPQLSGKGEVVGTVAPVYWESPETPVPDSMTFFSGGGDGGEMADR